MGMGAVNPLPDLGFIPVNTGIGSGTPPASAPEDPGYRTGTVKVGTESKGHREVIPSSWWHALHVIHTN